MNQAQCAWGVHILAAKMTANVYTYRICNRNADCYVEQEYCPLSITSFHSLRKQSWHGFPTGFPNLLSP
ncbi:hypothetical protein XELAEV_18046878mg [Xenopus laevis]|uniref:Uncharacterized protein n=1 Tax=Xenopus laevis TaxID=8355 RepID=A0A974BUN2_XENLA|nr:hypothetical protein XELAEV_18046878mg [Xenopus laevis]